MTKRLLPQDIVYKAVIFNCFFVGTVLYYVVHGKYKAPTSQLVLSQDKLQAPASAECRVPDPRLQRRCTCVRANVCLEVRRTLAYLCAYERAPWGATTCVRSVVPLRLVMILSWPMNHDWHVDQTTLDRTRPQSTIYMSPEITALCYIIIPYLCHQLWLGSQTLVDLCARVWVCVSVFL